MLFSLCPAVHTHSSYCDKMMVLGEEKGEYIILQFKCLNEPSLSYPETVIKASWSFSDVCREKTAFGSGRQDKEKIINSHVNSFF